MTGFTKLFGSITTSTIWQEDSDTRVVWITMLAAADRDGLVEASVPGLASLARVGLKETEAALNRFLTPDKYSRSSEYEGRRIEAVDGGWRILNYEKYRQRMSAEDVRERARLRQQRHRDRQRGMVNSDDDAGVSGDKEEANRDVSVTRHDNCHTSRESRHSRGRSRGTSRTEGNTGAGRGAGAQGLPDSPDSGPQSTNALLMLNAFVGVGATSFDLTLTNIEGVKVSRGFRRNCSPEELRDRIDPILQTAERNQHNVIIRPRSKTTTFVQLDDLDQGKLDRVAEFACVVARTSPGNFQAWIALQDATKEFAQRLRKEVGADPSASGAIRIAGSFNFKTKFAPDFPTVELIEVVADRIVTVSDLAALVTLKEPEDPSLSRNHSTLRKWPSYQRCVDGAPRVHQGERPDISKADFAWCLTAIDWGWGVEETANRLLELSPKAQENGPRYASTTAKNAATAVVQRKQS